MWPTVVFTLYSNATQYDTQTRIWGRGMQGWGMGGDRKLFQQSWAASWQNQQNGIRPVWSESSLYAQWVAKDPSFLHADSEDSHQTRRMSRLIWVFPGRTCHFVGFVMRWLKSVLHPLFRSQIGIVVKPSSQTSGYGLKSIFEPTHEILALFVLCKFILQIRMRSHPVELDVWFLVWPFVYFHSSCVRTAISTIISWAGSFGTCSSCMNAIYFIYFQSLG